MRIAITGATGFIGRYLVARLAGNGHDLKLWRRPQSDCGDFEEVEQRLTWIDGELGELQAAEALVEGCEAIIHGALWRPGEGFRGAEGDIERFVQTNVVGSLQLIEAARRQKVGRFVLISTCAVHEQILDDRPLDETHPLWPRSHYGAHKAALEKFVHSYGLGMNYPICALRPTGVYGVRRPIQSSKWYPLIEAVLQGQEVQCHGGGKEVHAADVAKAAELLLTASGVEGQAYNCYDRYVSQYEVAMFAKQISGSQSQVDGAPAQPKHQIATKKLRGLGMEFGGQPLWEQTIREMVQTATRI